MEAQLSHQTDISNGAKIKNRNKKGVLKKVKRSWQLYVLVSLAFLSIFIFSYIPMYGVVIAFQNFSAARGIWNSQWVGLEHFRVFYNSFLFWDLIRNTFLLSFWGTVWGFPIPIMLALAFNEARSGFFKKFTQTVSYAPNFISVVVMSGMVIAFLSPSVGIINTLLGFVGIGPINFLAEPGWFRTVFITSGIWQGMGWGSIIYLAALSAVDPTLHEAAIIDGASRLQRIWHINLPTIKPTIVILLILNIGGLMSVGFERVLLLQNDLNLSTSRIIATYIYDVGILGGRFSFAAAVGMFNSLINSILLIIANQFSKKVGEASLW